MSTKAIEAQKKAKTTVYMAEEEETMLNELFSSDCGKSEKQINLRFYARVFACYLRKRSGV